MHRALALLIAFAVSACSSSSASTPIPDAPTGFSAVFFADGIALSWDAVPNAAGYDVQVTHGSDAPRLFSTIDPRLGLRWDAGLSGLTFAVRTQAFKGRDRSKWSSAIAQPATFPTFSLSMDADGAHLTWSAPGVPATIGRWIDASPNDVTIAKTSSGTYDDHLLSKGETYNWQVVLGFPPVMMACHPLRGTAAPAAPSNVRVQYGIGPAFKVAWDYAKGAASYLVRRSNSAGVTSTPASAAEWITNCGETANCTFEVAGVTDAGVIGDYSAALDAANPPDVPGACTSISGVGKIILNFPVWPRFGDHLRIYRRGPQEANFTQIGFAYPPAFEDASVQPWASYEYEASAINAVGAESVVGWLGRAYATSTPDLSNLGAGGVEQGWPEGHSTTVPSGGRFWALAAPTAEPSSVGPDLRRGGNRVGIVFPPQKGEASILVPDLATGSGFMPFPPMTVSAGESIHFQVVRTDGNHFPLSAGVSDAASGGHTRNGSADTAHDLAFKAFFTQTSALVDPAPVGRSGLAANRLDWTASPGAIRYDVYREESITVGYVLIGSTTQQVWFVDDTAIPGRGYFYRVRAVAADDTFMESAAVATTRGDASAAENRGDAPSSQVELCPPPGGDAGGTLELAQSFVVQRSGVLSGLELAPEFGGGPTKVRILDSAGALLGSVDTGFYAAAVAPLLPRVPGTVVDLSGLGISVTQGDSLRIGLTASGSACTWFRETGDVYSDGQELRDGNAIAADLAFRVLVR